MKRLQVSYCITAIMYNAGRKAEVVDEFGVWATEIFKEKIDESFLKSIFLRLYPNACLWLPLTLCKFM